MAVRIHQTLDPNGRAGETNRREEMEGEEKKIRGLYHLIKGEQDGGDGRQVGTLPPRDGGDGGRERGGRGKGERKEDRGNDQ